MSKRVAIYLRVSTAEQTTDNQRRELEAVAQRAGWEVVQVFEDKGVSGTKGRDKRPAYDAMLKAVTRREVDHGGGVVGGPPGPFHAGTNRVPGRTPWPWR